MLYFVRCEQAQPGVPRANVAVFALETIEKRDFLNQLLTLTTD